MEKTHRAKPTEKQTQASQGHKGHAEVHQQQVVRTQEKCFCPESSLETQSPECLLRAFHIGSPCLVQIQIPDSPKKSRFPV
jgi:hypothetical protein